MPLRSRAFLSCLWLDVALALILLSSRCVDINCGHYQGAENELLLCILSATLNKSCGVKHAKDIRYVVCEYFRTLVLNFRCREIVDFVVSSPFAPMWHNVAREDLSDPTWRNAVVAKGRGENARQMCLWANNSLQERLGLVLFGFVHDGTSAVREPVTGYGEKRSHRINIFPLTVEFLRAVSFLAEIFKLDTVYHTTYAGAISVSTFRINGNSPSKRKSAPPPRACIFSTLSLVFTYYTHSWCGGFAYEAAWSRWRAEC